MKDLKDTVNDIDKFKELVEELYERKRIEEPIELNDAGKYIKSFRKERNITQNDFALALGLSKNVLAAIESGKKTVKLENFLKVTDAVGLKVVLYE